MRLFTTTLRGELGTDATIEISAARGESGQIGVLLRNVSRRLPPPGESDLLRAALGSNTEQIGNSLLRKLVKNTVASSSSTTSEKRSNLPAETARLRRSCWD